MLLHPALPSRLLQALQGLRPPAIRAQQAASSSLQVTHLLRARLPGQVRLRVSPALQARLRQLTACRLHKQA